MGEVMTVELLKEYEKFLRRQEKSPATIAKYMADLRRLKAFCGEEKITKEMMLRYKEHLKDEKHFKSSSINSYLVAANRFFDFLGWYGVKVKTFKVQRETFLPEERELTREEFKRLVKVAEAGDSIGQSRKGVRMSMVLQTIAVTGIRVSELSYLTVSGVKYGRFRIYNKGKERMILIPRKLQMKLLIYLKKQGITNGRVFVTASGKPLDRTYIWREMKKLCELAGVDAEKVFPHNLRALFARTYYHMFKDIAKLADLLGHSSIETTRIYIRTSGAEHRKQMDEMRLLAGL